MLDLTEIPKDTPILVYARWGWDNYEPNEDYEWRVCTLTLDWVWEETYEFITITSNPYSDKATDPKAWKELPKL